MRKLVIVLMAALFATSAIAQIDEDPNMIGVYFDMDGMTVCSAEFGNQTAYVLATRVTYEAIYAWEAAIFVDNQDMAGFVNHVGVPSGIDGLQIGAAPNIIMAFAAPIPVGGTAVVIGEIAYGFYGAGASYLSLGANDANPSIPGHLAVQVGPTAEDIVPFGDSANGGTCAIIGDVECDVVATENVNFGNVKAMYR